MMARGRMRTQNAADWHEWQGACDREGVSCAALKVKIVALARLCEAEADLIGALLSVKSRRKRGDSRGVSELRTVARSSRSVNRGARSDGC
jgi:hypothetical protein